MTTVRNRLAAFFAVLAVIVTATAVATPALGAENAVVIAVVDSPKSPPSYRSNWLIVAEISINKFILGSSAGTVDVYLDGAADVFATGLPIQGDGRVYLAQPTAKQALAAGEHKLALRFVPASDSYLTAGGDAVIALTIAALTAKTEVTVSADPAIASAPIITATTTGTWVRTMGGQPPGSWKFSVTDSEGKTVFASTVDQAASARQPLTVSIGSGVRQGKKYTLSSVFTPVGAEASGITVANAQETSFRTADGSPAELLVAPVEVPPWLLAVLGIFILALAAAVVLLSRRRVGTSPTVAEPPSEDAN